MPLSSHSQKYADVLDRLAVLLRRKPMTAREVARVLGCCKPTAYERLAALRRRGDRVYVRAVMGNATTTGPRAVAYGIR